MRRPAQKRRGERPQEPAKASTQNRANTPKSLTAQMEPRYYGQVPFRGCSLMVKPQSSKLITRVRFPSSPPLQRLRRKRRGLFAFRGFRESLPGENTFPRALGIFALQPVIPSRTISGIRLRMRIYFLARSESARSSSSSPPPRIHTKHPTKPREIGEYALSGNKPCTSRCVGHLAGKQVN